MMTCGRTFSERSVVFRPCSVWPRMGVASAPASRARRQRDRAAACIRMRPMPSSRSAGGLTEFLDHLLAHLEFLNLSGDGRRESLHQADVAGNLVMGDLGAAEGTYRFLVECGAVTRDDPRAQFLSVPLIGHADDLHVLDVGMPVEKLFDFARIDV